MKRLFTLLLLTFCFAVTAQTSRDEYNYITKGLKSVVDQGMDLKQGYTITELKKYKVGDEYAFVFYSFRRSDNSLSCIAVVALSYWGNTYYLCMPLKNQDLKRDYFKDVSKWDRPMQNAYNQALSDLLIDNFEMLK